MKKMLIAAGGDIRQIYAASCLTEKYSVRTIGFDQYSELPENIRKAANEKADIILLPCPVSKDNISLNTSYSDKLVPVSSLIHNMNEDCKVIGGMISEPVQKLFEASGFEVYDYMKQEEYCIKNAVSTAEGAVQIALREMPVTLYESNVIITGMGRIGKVLIKLLSAFGSKITVASERREELVWAEIAGCKSIPLYRLSDALEAADLIINTIPAVIFNEKNTDFVSRNCLIIDLASKPGGVDLNVSENAEIKVIRAPGLPGQTAPESSGKILAQTVMNILTERSETHEQTERS